MDAAGRLFLNRRSAALLLLGFSSGLPYITLTSSLTFWLTDAGGSETQIGLLSLATLPYAAKFLWAPLVDDRRPWWPRSWGRRRSWILWMQILLAGAMALAAFAGPWGTIAADTNSDSRGLDADTIVWSMVAIGIVVALLSATQDISVDAYRADVSDDETRAASASMGVTGFRLAMAGAGAGAIMLAARIGWPAAFGATAIVMLLCTGASALARDPPDDRAPRRPFREAVIEPVRALIARLGHRAWLVGAFVILFKLPDTLPAPMVPPLLLRHLGYGTDDVAIMRQAVGLGVTIIGALAGAAIVPMLGMRRSLLVFGILQALSTGAFAMLALLHLPADHASHAAHWLAPASLALLVSVLVEYFCQGIVTAGFVAYLMWLCERRWSATQYAIVSSLMAVGTSLAGAAGGRFAQALIDWRGAEQGWPLFFSLCVLAGLPALVLVPFVTKRELGARP